MAAGLEAVGKAGDAAFIRESLPGFAKKLVELVKNIRDALGQNEPEYHKAASHSPLFNELYDALKSQKISEIKRILNTLNQQTQESQLKKILEQISDQVLITEFDAAVKIVEELLMAGN